MNNARTGIRTRTILGPWAWILLSAACGTTTGERQVADLVPPQPVARVPAESDAEAGAQQARPHRPQSTDYEAPLTVFAAVREALSNNRAVLQARVNALVSGTFAREARAGLRPRLDVTGSYRLRDEPPKAVAPELGATFSVGPKDETRLNVGLSFPIWGFGRYLNRYRAALLTERSAAALSRAAESDVAALVSAAAFDLLEAQRSLDAARSNEAAFAQQVKDAQALRDAGRVTDDAVLEAQVSHDVAVRDREKIESLIPILRIILNGLLGRPTDAPTTIIDAPEEREPEWDLADLEAEALVRRPEMISARLEIEAAQRSVRAATAEALPELRGAVTWDTTDSPFSAPKDVFALGLTLNIPLYTGGATPARIRRAKYDLELAQIRRNDLETQIRTEIAQAYRNVREAYRDIPVAKRSIERAAETLRIQREKFASGRATSQDVLQTTTTLSAARFAYVQALYAYNVALQELHRARGADPTSAPLPYAAATPAGTEE